MAKIKIISNPYDREITYFSYNEASGEWIANDDVNQDGYLRSIENKRCFLPFKIKEIINLIVSEYGSSDEAIEIIFQGTNEEWNAIEKGECYPGIAICGSGEGINMTLNKHQGIRAGLSWIPEIAHLCRQHNDANVLVMPGRFIDTDMARKIMDEFFSTEFEGGRHQSRIDKMVVKQ